MNGDPGLRQMKAEQWFISKLRAIAPEKAVRVFSGTTDSASGLSVQPP